MKKFLLSLAVFAFVGTASISAQDVQPVKKSCTKTAAVTGKKACSASAAAKLAANDASIEAKTCAKSGTTSYVRKSTCAASGKTSFTNVKYCSTSGKFVNVSPSNNAKVAADKPACTGKAKATSTSAKKSCSGSAKATSVSGKKGCSKPCSKSAKTSSKEAKAKMVKAETEGEK